MTQLHDYTVDQTAGDNLVDNE